MLKRRRGRSRGGRLPLWFALGQGSGEGRGQEHSSRASALLKRISPCGPWNFSDRSQSLRVLPLVRRDRCCTGQRRLDVLKEAVPSCLPGEAERHETSGDRVGLAVSFLERIGREIASELLRTYCFSLTMSATFSPQTCCKALTN